MFSKTTEYALRATIFLAQKSSVHNKLGIEAIAKAIDSPIPFTAKILQLLAKDGTLVSSTRGPHGGFYMSEEAKPAPIKKKSKLTMMLLIVAIVLYAGTTSFIESVRMYVMKPRS